MILGESRRKCQSPQPHPGRRPQARVRHQDADWNSRWTRNEAQAAIAGSTPVETSVQTAVGTAMLPVHLFIESVLSNPSSWACDRWAGFVREQTLSPLIGPSKTRSSPASLGAWPEHSQASPQRTNAQTRLGDEYPRKMYDPDPHIPQLSGTDE
jgi:hypothetical protein